MKPSFQNGKKDIFPQDPKFFFLKNFFIDKNIYVYYEYENT